MPSRSSSWKDVVCPLWRERPCLTLFQSRGILQVQGFLSWKLICNLVFTSPRWTSASLLKYLCPGPFGCPVAGALPRVTKLEMFH